MTDDKHVKERDGKIDRHINDEKKWRDFNARIFDALKNRRHLGQRDIKYCREDKLIDFKHEFIEQLPDNVLHRDNEALRNEWHARAKNHLAKCDLVFFDPDIGVIDKLSKSVVKDSEYCLTSEIEDYDWLVVVFPKHAKRYSTLKANPIVTKADQLGKKVIIFIYGGMALLYISKTIQAEIFSRVFKEWDTKIDTKILVP